jgi:HlyD family secretion protein
MRIRLQALSAGTPPPAPADGRALADAKAALAEATVADLQAQLDKTRLVAPADGVVGAIVAEQGGRKAGPDARLGQALVHLHSA